MATEPVGKSRLATIEIAGEEFVLVPRAEYERLRGGSADTVDAVAFGSRTLGRSLRAARQEAGMTQVELAKKLRRSQALVSSAESGAVRIGQRYVRSVLRACRLPDDWKPPAPSKLRALRRRSAEPS